MRITCFAISQNVSFLIFPRKSRKPLITTSPCNDGSISIAKNKKGKENMSPSGDTSNQVAIQFDLLPSQIDGEELPPNSRIRPSSLSRTLRLLFGLNGFSLSFQTLAMMYIINTRVGIPLPYLPTYGAIAFLPFSLKPLYAYLSADFPRHRLLTGLLTCNGLSIIFTALIPKGGILICFIVAFLRGIFDSWAELCLGLTLIDQAQRPHRALSEQQQQEPFDKLASRFQSQAATSRNLGSLMAAFLTCLMLIYRQVFSPSETQLSGEVADALLVTTGVLNILGALVVFKCRDGSDYSSPLRLDIQDSGSDEEKTLCENQSHPSYSSLEDSDDSDDDHDGDKVCSDSVFIMDESLSTSAMATPPNPIQFRGNFVLVVLLQLCVVVFAMKGPIASWTSYFAWNVLIISLILTLVLTAAGMYLFLRNGWQMSHKVGLFLILRHATPSVSMLLGSFMYSLFQSRPLYLQVLSLVSMGMTTLASWTYGQVLSHYSSGRPMQAVIIGTTIIAGLLSLSNILLVNQARNSGNYLFPMALLIRMATTFAEEWSFLPDVVLATTSLSVEKQSLRQQQPSDSDSSRLDQDNDRVVVVGHAMSSSESIQHNAADTNPHTGTQHAPSSHDATTAKKVAMEYGTLISCLDFGDQLGALLAGPLVALLGISRENNWEHLNAMILICSLCGMASLSFLGLIQSK
jgi:hypothetical protein